jgi:hypothetical protein
MIRRTWLPRPLANVASKGPEVPVYTVLPACCTCVLNLICVRARAAVDHMVYTPVSSRFTTPLITCLHREGTGVGLTFACVCASRRGGTGVRGLARFVVDVVKQPQQQQQQHLPQGAAVGHLQHLQEVHTYVYIYNIYIHIRCVRRMQRTYADVCPRPAVYVSIRHVCWYAGCMYNHVHMTYTLCISQHTSDRRVPAAYVSIRQHTSRMLTYAGHLRSRCIIYSCTHIYIYVHLRMCAYLWLHTLY